MLVDSREAFVRSMNAALVAHGAAAREPDTLVRYLGPPLHATFAELMGGEEHVDACVAAYRSRYHDEGFAESVVFDGIPEALDALRAAGLPLVVATSKSVDSAVPLLAALGLAERFIAIIGPAVPRPKIVLEPKHPSRTVGLGQCIVAHVHDSAGHPLEGLVVHFVDSGPNPHRKSIVTDSFGTATFCYFGKHVGKDRVKASVQKIDAKPATITWKH